MTMKKSLIAVAVAGVIAAPMTASAAEVYGRVNLALENNNDDASSATEDEGLGLASISSRWGVQGSEDLGNGLTAGFHYEASIDATSAAFADDGRLSYVSLGGDFGEIKAGHMYPAFYNHVAVLTDWAYSEGAPAYYQLPSYVLRESNTLQYNYGSSSNPFSFSVEGTFDQDSTGGPNDAEDIDSTTFAGTFNGGPFTVSAGVLSFAAPTGAEPTLTGFGGTYSMGDWGVRASYVIEDRDDGSNEEPAALDVLVHANFGDGLDGMINFGMYDHDAPNDEDNATSITGQLQQALSSRTKVYGEFNSTSIDGGTGADTDPQEFRVGVVHFF